MLSLPEGVATRPAAPEMDALNVVVAMVPAGQEEQYRRQLAALPGVLFAEPNYLVQPAVTIPDDTRWGDQYGPGNVQATEAWDLTTGSSNVVIAIVDSGIDSGHPEFSGRLLRGYDFVEGDRTPQDGCGHGTHVAGIAAANSNNQRGIAGIDWQAKVLPVRVLGNNCLGSTETVARGIVWATDQGADIINLSLGLAGPSRLLEYATYYAYDRGTAVFAAAGNTGGSFIYYPAAYPWVLAVGGVNASNARASFSNRGSALDLMAPGANVLSTTPRSGVFYYQTVYGTHNEYGELSGTSMATAHVSGAAALLLAHDPARFYSPDRLYHAFIQTANDLGQTVPNDDIGYGLLQIYDALQYSGSFPPDPPPPVISVEYDTYSSTRCQNIYYEWIDASVVPPLFIPGNDSSADVSLPFNFTFGGQEYTAGSSITVSANGYLSFDGVGGEAVNYPIPLPDAGPPYNRSNWFIAPFWDDLNPSANPAASRIYARLTGAFPYRRFVIAWHNLPIQAASSSTSVTFQAVLYETLNLILFQYRALRGPGSDGSSATIGIEYADGKAGAQYAFNQPGALLERQAILFGPVVPGSTRTTPGCLYATSAGAGGGIYPFAPWGVEIPAGLLGGSATLRISIFSSFGVVLDNFFPIGRYVDITLDPAPRPPFSLAPQVYYLYNSQDLLAAGGNPKNLFLAAYDAGTRTWQRLPTALDEAGQRLTAPVSHFSVFGVFTPGQFGSGQPGNLPVTGAARRPAEWPLWLLLLLAALAVKGWQQCRRR